MLISFQRMQNTSRLERYTRSIFNRQTRNWTAASGIIQSISTRSLLWSYQRIWQKTDTSTSGMKMEEAGSTPRHSKQQSTIMTIIIMVMLPQKSTNNLLAQLMVFNSSPCEVKLSLCFTNQNDMKAHAQKLHAFLTGQW